MRPYDERLQHLLAATVKVFAEKGFHATSMRDLARASGLSLAGIYHYVSGKTELLYLIQDRCFTQVIQGARSALEPGADPTERLQAFIRHHVDFFTRHMEEMKVLSHEEDELAGTMRAQIRKRKREYVNLLLALLDDVSGAPVNRQVAVYALFGMLNWIYTWYKPDGPVPPARLADDLAQLFLHGYLQPITHAAVPLVATHGG
ncbi:MAG: TetR/AcrR family transcriptional regulator [Gemmatimonadales bacterium]